MKKRYYIAYGSNLNKEQMKRRCPGSKCTGISILEDWKLMFKGSKTGSYLTIEKSKGDIVPVGIWSVTNEDEQKLDMYEGYPTFYYKKDLKVNLINTNGKKKESISCFVYIMQEDRPYGMPFDGYIKTCTDGYRDFGFDTKYLIAALENTAEEVKKDEEGYAGTNDEEDVPCVWM